MTTMIASSALRDPSGLDALERALDTGAMSRQLAGCLVAPKGLRVVAAEVIAISPGKRAVIAYRTSGLEGDGSSLIGKLYADPVRARRLHALLEELHALDVAGDRCAVPRPVAHLPDLGMSVQAAALGSTLDRLEGGERHQAVVEAGRWLSSLHHSGISLDRRLDMGRENRKLTLWAEVVVHEHPSAKATVARLLDGLTSLAAELDVSATVPIHKDYQYQHVLFDGDQAVVLDLDEMRTGDPAFDVAHFGANLRLLALREALTNEESDRLQDAFLDGYRSRTSYTPDVRHEYFRAYTCLKIAKQMVRGRGPAPAPVGLELSRQLRLILEEGLRGPGR